MLKNETLIREGMVTALNSMIEAVKTDDESQYIISKARVSVYEDVLCMNVYGRDLIKKAGGNVYEQ